MFKLFQRRPGGNWSYKFTLSGQTIYRSTGTADKTRAQEIAANAYAAAFDTLKAGKKPRHVWQEAVIKYLNESQHLKSLKTIKDHLRWLSPHLDNKHLDEIDKAAIEQLITEKRKTTGTTRTNRMTGTVSAILNKAHKEWGWLDTVPHIRKFKEANQRLRWLTQEEADTLLEQLNPHTRAMAEFTLATGLRQDNVTKLEWSQIDIKSKLLWIHADQSKNGEIIRVPLNADALRVLSDQRQIRQQYGLMAHNRVFTYKGQPVDIANTKAWRNALKKANINDFCWHGLRHTWASWHVQAGTSLQELQELGGWKSYDMVLRYAHLAPDRLAKSAANIERNSAKPLQAEKTKTQKTA